MSCLIVVRLAVSLPKNYIIVQDCSVDDLVQELPTHLPRYVAYSYCYKHDDGRVSYPLCFFFVSPEGTNSLCVKTYIVQLLQSISPNFRCKTRAADDVCRVKTISCQRNEFH